MHAPPPYQINLSRFGVWRVVCGLLAFMSLAVTLAWGSAAMPVHPAGVALATLAWAIGSFVLLTHAWRLASLTLRWDGQVWALTTVRAEPSIGRVSVAIDLGAWMLLHFVPFGPGRSLWLPAQRRGHEVGWPALRATVYCARPVASSPAAPF